MAPIPPAAPPADFSPTRRHLGQGIVCSDTIYAPPSAREYVEWTLHHPLSFSAIRSLPSSGLWHLHAQIRELIRNCYGSSFALDDGDGLDDPALVARHDSWVLVDMLLREREMGLKPEPIPLSSITAPAIVPPPELAELWQSPPIIVRDFADGVHRNASAETRLKLADIFDLTDYEERQAGHLAALSSNGCRQRRRSSTRSSSRSPSPTTAIWTVGKPQQNGGASPRHEVCQYGCKGDCCKINHSATDIGAQSVEQGDLLMAGAPPGSKRASISPLFTDFFVRNKDTSRPAWLRRSSSMFASALRTQRTASLEVSCPPTPGAPAYGRQRFDDVTRRLSSVGLACRNSFITEPRIFVRRVSGDDDRDLGDELKPLSIVGRRRRAGVARQRSSWDVVGGEPEPRRAEMSRAMDVLGREAGKRGVRQ